MNTRWKPPAPLSTPGEALLALVAIKIELSRTQHRLAVERYESIRKHIERADSPLAALVVLFYPQGSMAIGATIRAKRREDGYDIDIVVELGLPPHMPPHQVLNLLYRAVKGDPGSRYHDCTERQSRCVTVHYADGMHLDLTPSVLLEADDPRRSHIFHSKPEASRIDDRHLVINSYAFVERFNAMTPVDHEFGRAYALQAQKMDPMLALMAADSEDVPAHSSEVGGKSATVVALQLLKRNRNITYAPRTGMRMPPSAMLAALALEITLPGRSVLDALDELSYHVLTRLLEAHRLRRLIDVRNPTCWEDRFTDRWPGTLSAQERYIGDLIAFRKQLARYRAPGLSLKEQGDLLTEMFGEHPGREAVRTYADEIAAAGHSGRARVTSTGGLILGTPASVAAAPAVPKHSFFGSTWKKP